MSNEYDFNISFCASYFNRLCIQIRMYKRKKKTADAQNCTKKTTTTATLKIEFFIRKLPLGKTVTNKKKK